MKPEDEKTQEEIMNERIAELQTRIKNAEYDLQNSFKGNTMIKNKLEGAQKELQEKQALLQKIKQSPEANKEMHKVESQIDEQTTSAITNEQMQKLNEEIENEL